VTSVFWDRVRTRKQQAVVGARPAQTVQARGPSEKEMGGANWTGSTYRPHVCSERMAEGTSNIRASK